MFMFKYVLLFIKNIISTKLHSFNKIEYDKNKNTYFINKDITFDNYYNFIL